MKDLFKLIAEGDIAAIKEKLHNLSTNTENLLHALSVRNNKQQTLLHIAAVRGDIAIVRMLLETGHFSVLAEDENQATACTLANNAGHKNIAELLKTQVAWDNAFNDQAFDLKRLSDTLKAAKKNAEQAINKELIMFVGNTGVGKSTLVNYLNGARYSITHEQNTGFSVAKLISGSEVVATGHGAHSETFYPQVVNTQHGQALCDLPGFTSTRGANLAFCESNASELIKQTCLGVKTLVIVVEHESLQINKAAAFKDVMLRLKTMLGTHYKALLPHICLAVTKTEKYAPNKVTPTGIKSIIAAILGMPANKRQSISQDSLWDRYLAKKLSASEQDLVELLVAIYENQALPMVVDITDQGYSRQHFFTCINQTQSIDKDQINFTEAEPAQIEFKKLLQHVEQTVISCKQRLQKLDKAKEALAQQQTAAEQLLKQNTAQQDANANFIQAQPAALAFLNQILNLYNGQAVNIMPPQAISINMPNILKWQNGCLQVPDAFELNNGNFVVQADITMLSQQPLTLQLAAPSAARAGNIQNAITQLHTQLGRANAQQGLLDNSIQQLQNNIARLKQQLPWLEDDIKAARLVLNLNQHLLKRLIEINTITQLMPLPNLSAAVNQSAPHTLSLFKHKAKAHTDSQTTPDEQGMRTTTSTTTLSNPN